MSLNTIDSFLTRRSSHGDKIIHFPDTTVYLTKFLNYCDQFFHSYDLLAKRFSSKVFFCEYDRNSECNISSVTKTNLEKVCGPTALNHVKLACVEENKACRAYWNTTSS